MTKYWILPSWLTIHSPLLCGLLLARCQYLHRSNIVWVGYLTHFYEQRITCQSVDHESWNTLYIFSFFFFFLTSLQGIVPRALVRTYMFIPWMTHPSRVNPLMVSNNVSAFAIQYVYVLYVHELLRAMNRRVSFHTYYVPRFSLPSPRGQSLHFDGCTDTVVVLPQLAAPMPSRILCHSNATEEEGKSLLFTGEILTKNYRREPFVKITRLHIVIRVYVYEMWDRFEIPSCLSLFLTYARSVSAHSLPLTPLRRECNSKRKEYRIILN